MADDLLWQHLFFPDVDEGDDELSKSLYTDPNRVGDDLPDPVGRFFRKAADNHVIKGDAWSWDEEVVSTGASLHKREADLDFTDIEADAKLFVKRLNAEFGV